MRRPALALIALLVACSSETPATDPATIPTTVPSPSSPVLGTPPTGSGTATPPASGATPASIQTEVPRGSRETIRPPAAGTYTYSQEGTQTFGALRFSIDPEGTFEVDPPTNGGGVVRQHATRRTSEDRSRETMTRFTRSAILLEETIEHVQIGAASEDYRCRTPEPIVLLPVPWQIGERWRGGGRCEPFMLSYSAQLVRTESRMVGGVAVDTLVIRAIAEITSEELTQRSELQIWLAPSWRLVVRQVEHSTGTYSGTPYTRDLTEDLTSLAPA